MRLIEHLLQRPAAPAAPVERADAIPGQSAATVLMQTWGTPDSERISPTFNSYAADGYAGNAVIFGVILARLSLFSEAEFKWQDLTTRKLFGSPELSILEEPWPNGSTGELLARMEQDVSLAGNAYIAPAGDGLQRLRPDRVVIASVEDVDSWGRRYRRKIGYAHDVKGDGSTIDMFDAGEVAHWSPIPDPLATWRGMSWLTPVVREVNADTALTSYKVKYLENAATPNLLVKYPKDLRKEQVTELGERFAARYGGMDNAYKTLILDGGADATVVGGTFEQLNFTAVQAAGENRIAAAGGVPGIVVGLKEGLQAATYSNYEQAMRRFADITMRPNWRTAAAALANLLPPRPGARLWFDAAGIAALRQGEKDRADTAAANAATISTLVQAGFEPASVVDAVTAGDLSQLKPGTQAPPAGGQQP